MNQERAGKGGEEVAGGEGGVEEEERGDAVPSQ